MIVFDLECSGAQHRFEGWFKSSDDFTRQQERGLVSCPHCGSVEVAKAVQAPRLTRKGNQLPDVSRPPATRPRPAPAAPVAHSPLPAQAVQLMQALGRMQAELLKTSRDAGDRFVEDARAMHYGERDAETIHGRATLVEAKELLEEGIAVMPLPFPVVPPEQAN
ncbi:DUF1178 family protein [Novosphingobium soli]|uniref:DUF1178 family protein n=1 Tax=Novosphingobium soli TaxID=574956 RepID=A0ABV6CT73_9SPHN